MVKALRYQSGRPGNFFVAPPTELCALGSTQPLKMNTRDFYWGKGGRCLWLTTYHLRSAERLKIRGLNVPGTPWVTSACCGMSFTFDCFRLELQRRLQKVWRLSRNYPARHSCPTVMTLGIFWTDFRNILKHQIS